METRIGIVTTGGSDGASISIKEIDASSNGSTGAILTAKNISGATVAVNDRGIITRDLDGTLSFFFKSSSSTPSGTQGIYDMWSVINNSHPFPFQAAHTNIFFQSSVIVNIRGFLKVPPTSSLIVVGTHSATLTIDFNADTWDITTPVGSSSGAAFTTNGGNSFSGSDGNPYDMRINIYSGHQKYFEQTPVVADFGTEIVPSSW